MSSSKLLSYFGSATIAFVLALFVIYSCWGDLNDGNGNKAGAIFMALCNVMVATTVLYLLRNFKYISSIPYITIPVLSVIIIVLEYISFTAYVNHYVSSSIEYFVNPPVRTVSAEEQSIKQEAINFIQDNFKNLTSDMAAGNGEYLNKLIKQDYFMGEPTRLGGYGTPNYVTFAFYAQLKADYKQLITPQTTAQQLFDKLIMEDSKVDQLYEDWFLDIYSKSMLIGLVTENWQTIKEGLKKESPSSDDRFWIRDFFVGRQINDKQEEVVIKMIYAKKKQLLSTEQTTPEQFVNNVESELSKLGINLKSIKSN